LFVWALGAMGAAAAAKLAVQEWRRANAELDKAKEAAVTPAETDKGSELQRDPETGVYRPR
jgi:hypothetical protein